jgi:hypothetical protein
MRTGLRRVGGFRLFCGCFLDESSSDSAADFVGPLFNRGEIEVLEVFVGTVDVSRDFIENPLETGVERSVRGGVAKHVGLP